MQISQFLMAVGGRSSTAAETDAANPDTFAKMLDGSDDLTAGEQNLLADTQGAQPGEENVEAETPESADVDTEPQLDDTEGAQSEMEAEAKAQEPTQGGRIEAALADHEGATRAAHSDTRAASIAMDGADSSTDPASVAQDAAGSGTAPEQISTQATLAHPDADRGHTEAAQNVTEALLGDAEPQKIADTPQVKQDHDEVSVQLEPAEGRPDVAQPAMQLHQAKSGDDGSAAPALATSAPGGPKPAGVGDGMQDAPRSTERQSQLQAVAARMAPVASDAAPQVSQPADVARPVQAITPQTPPVTAKAIEVEISRPAADGGDGAPVALAGRSAEIVSGTPPSAAAVSRGDGAAAVPARDIRAVLREATSGAVEAPAPEATAAVEGDEAGSFRTLIPEAARQPLRTDVPQPSAPRSAVVQNVLDQVAKVPAEPGTTVIRLKPHGMGMIEISVVASGEGPEGLEVELRVQNPLVLEALRADRSAITQLLGSAPGAQPSLSLEMLPNEGRGQGQGQSADQKKSDARRSGDLEDDEGEAQPEARDNLRDASGRINILT